ncbi:hypothetical protein OG622_26085 [Streptomyces sp. NBC_01314]|nr:hypothetical protein OG622_26085 [Streptomyces sp. NBC_01314]
MREPGGWRFSHTRTLARGIPVLLIAIGLFYDHFTPREFTAVPFFTAAPLVAAPLFSLHGTVITGIASIAGITAVRLHSGDTGRVDAITEIATVATVAVLAVLINRLVRRSDARLCPSAASGRGGLPGPDHAQDACRRPGVEYAGDQFAQGRSGRAAERTHPRSVHRNGS